MRGSPQPLAFSQHPHRLQGIAPGPGVRWAPRSRGAAGCPPLLGRHQGPQPSASLCQHPCHRQLLPPRPPASRAMSSYPQALGSMGCHPCAVESNLHPQPLKEPSRRRLAPSPSSHAPCQASSGRPSQGSASPLAPLPSQAAASPGAKLSPSLPPPRFVHPSARGRGKKVRAGKAARARSDHSHLPAARARVCYHGGTSNPTEPPSTGKSSAFQ